MKTLLVIIVGIYQVIALAICLPFMILLAGNIFKDYQNPNRKKTKYYQFRSPWLK